MTAVFVDTSALIALVSATDEAHEPARRAFERLRAARATLITSSYVLVETYALIGRRFGPDAVRAFREELAPLLRVEWVGPDDHEAGLDRVLAGPGQPSLVDAVSFLMARRARVDRVFAFDRHFELEGFRLAR